MNAERHTHNLQLSHVSQGKRRWVRLTYGDQDVDVRPSRFFGKPLAEKVEEAARAMIRHHDAASIRAGERAAAEEALRARVQVLAKEEAGAGWGVEAEPESEVFEPTTTPLPIPHREYGVFPKYEHYAHGTFGHSYAWEAECKKAEDERAFIDRVTTGVPRRYARRDA